MFAVPLTMWNTRLILLPLTVSTLAPGPAIVTSSLIASSPPVSAMLPTTLDAKLIVSAPGLLFVEFIASRSVQSPAEQAPSSWSVFLLTTNPPTIGVGVLLGVGVFVGVGVIVG